MAGGPGGGGGAGVIDHSGAHLPGSQVYCSNHPSENLDLQLNGKKNLHY